MSQEHYKIFKKDDLNPLEYLFHEQNITTLRWCLKHKSANKYIVLSTDGQFCIFLNNEKNAIEITLSDKNINLQDILETDLQEELEGITAENIQEKSKEILKRFNKKFKLNVDFNPNLTEINEINESVKATTWNKENTFLLNFYMMEVFRRKYNFKWKFKIIETFNPFFCVSLDDDFEGADFYRYLLTSRKIIFDFEKHLGRFKHYNKIKSYRKN